MKPIIQLSKIFLFFLAMLTTKESSAQLIPVTFTTNQGQCVDLGIDTMGFSITTFNVLSGPFNGQLIPGIRPGSWIYCPDSSFIGTDQATVYACLSGPTFPICDTVQLTFVVQVPCNLSITIQNGPCAGPLPSLEVVATGGAPPYSYQWSNGATTAVLCNLSQGTYCVTVFDGSGCSVSSCSTAGSNCQLSGFIYEDSLNCGGATGLTVFMNGGTSPYSYAWTTGDITQTICVTVPGTYCLTVTDISGCDTSFCYTLSGCQLVPTIFMDSTGCLFTTVSGGSPGYTYLWSNGVTTNFNCPPNVSPGSTYCITVTDASACSGTTCYTVPNGGCNMTVTLYPDSTPCMGPLPSIGSFVSGGTPPYSYSWSTGDSTEFICNLTPGNYLLTVTDALGCIDSALYRVTGCQLFSTITQSGSCLSVTATGGTPGYTYAWSNGESTASICPVTPGTYCVTVTDAQSCIDIQCGTVGGGCQIATTVIADSINGCVSAITTGGTPPYTYLWVDGDTGITNCSIFLTPNACVTVTDAVGCEASDCYSGGCPLQVTIFIDSSDCLNAVASGGTAPYRYDWSNGVAGPATCVQGFPGTYCVTVTDANNCSGIACYTYQPTGACSFTYTQVASSPTTMVFAASFDSTFFPPNILWDFGDGHTAIGTVVTHIYTTCNFYPDITMTIADTLGNGLCSFTQTVYIPCFPNSFCQARFAPSQDSLDDLTFHFADLSVYNPVSFAWDFGDGNSSTLQNPSYTFDTTGIYNVCLTVADSNGCTSTICKQINAGNFQVYDLTAYLHHNTTVTPGFQLWTRLTFCNNGTTIRSGTIEYRYPAGTFPAPGTSFVTHDTAQRLLTFSFSNLLPGDCRTKAVTMLVDVTLPLGSTACDTMWVKPIVGDINPSNNVSTVCDVVVGSWDPNDKSNSPKGLGDDGEIPVGTRDLSYLIRFQNTGSAPAEQVEIKDIIDNNIDLTSVKVSEASHPHITQIIGNELVVTFNNIQLPDSNTNEPASHGYIVVIARLKPGLTPGTQIFNTADIYFDFNTPVITNTVVNTLKDTVSGIKPIAGLDFSVMPNPAYDEVIVAGKFNRNSMFEIMNELGQVVLNGDINSDQTKISIDKLTSGIYFLKVKSKDKTGVQRLVVLTGN